MPVDPHRDTTGGQSPEQTAAARLQQALAEKLRQRYVVDPKLDGLIVEHDTSGRSLRCLYKEKRALVSLKRIREEGVERVAAAVAAQFIGESLPLERSGGVPGAERPDIGPTLEGPLDDEVRRKDRKPQ